MIDQILKASIHDVAELNVLVNAAYRGETAKGGWTHESDLIDGSRIDENELKRLIRAENNVVLKYVRKGKIIGCVLLERNTDSIYLGMLTVKPLLQSTGIGKKLLAASEEYSRSKGCGNIKMTVISIRKELIEFYKRFGYEDTGIKKA